MKKSKVSIKKVLLTALTVFLGLVLALLIAATVVINAVLNKIPRVERVEGTLSAAEIDKIVSETDPYLPDETYETVDPESVEDLDGNAPLIEKQDHIVNILLIGQDEVSGIRTRSDSMMLCTLNLKENTLVLTSFQRDLYVDLPDHNGISYEDNRLNTCYMFGGAEMLNTALRNNFGVQVDHNIAVDFTSFPRVIDTMGGVAVYLTSAEAQIVGAGSREGFNILNGKQALTYSRIRQIDSDFSRARRQRAVVTSLIDQAKNMSVEQLLGLIDVIFPMISTDMSNGQILAYAIRILPMLKDLQIKQQYIPAEGTYKAVYIRGMAVLVPDLEANRQLLRDTIG